MFTKDSLVPSTYAVYILFLATIILSAFDLGATVLLMNLGIIEEANLFMLFLLNKGLLSASFAKAVPLGIIGLILFFYDKLNFDERIFVSWATFFIFSVHLVLVLFFLLIFISVFAIILFI